eukprot:7225463-Prymnesium_polylepis.1
MQVHPRFLFANGLSDDQYCALEARLRPRYRLAYRFAYVWERWVHRDHARAARFALTIPPASA